MPGHEAPPVSRFGPAPTHHQRPMFALVLRLISALLFSLVLLLVKLLSERGLWLPETLVWRQIVPSVVLFGWLLVPRRRILLRTARPWLHAQRAVIGAVSMLLVLGVVLLLPLAEATVIGFTAPIFAVILSVLVLGERVGTWRIGAVTLGLLGVLIMANPHSAHLPLAGIAVGIAAAFMVAVVSIQLRDLGRTESPVTIVFYFSAMSTPMLAVLLPFVPAGYDRPFHHDLASWLMLAAIGVLGMISQLLQTASLRYGRVSSVIVMDYAQFGWSMLWGWLVFHHLPPASTWLGAPAIIASGLIIAWREQVRSARAASAAALEARAV